MQFACSLSVSPLGILKCVRTVHGSAGEGLMTYIGQIFFK
jgi:hypothetical protein